MDPLNRERVASGGAASELYVMCLRTANSIAGGKMAIPETQKDWSIHAIISMACDLSVGVSQLSSNRKNGNYGRQTTLLG